MKIETFELKLEKPQEYIYLAGEEIKGNLNIIIKDKIRIARLSIKTIGSTFTYWQYFNNEYESKEINLEIYKDLTKEMSIYCDKTMELNCGEYKLEFVIKIPINAISSFNEIDYGNIKYLIIATLDIAEDCGESEILSEFEIQLRSFLTLDSPHFLNPTYSTEEIVNEKSYICFCKSQKRIKLTLRSSSLGLLPDMYIVINYGKAIKEEIRKRKIKTNKMYSLFNFILNKNLGMKLSLCQQIEFMACKKDNRNIWEKKLITRVIQSYNNNSIVKCEILSNSEQQIQFQIPCNLQPTSAKENGLINFSYFFRIEIEQNFDIILPIVIGSFKTIL